MSVVHVKNRQTDDSVTFAVDVPLDAADGDYTIRLKAQGQNIADTMDLALTVSAEEIGESSFTAEYPSQEGDADTAFTFSATLINNTLSSQTYSFTVNAPTGWQVSFLPSGETTKVAALDVEARTTQAVDISVTPPENIEAGTYEIPCTATSVNETMTIDLSVTITGSYAMSLSTPSGRLSLEAYANQESAVQLSLTNTGNSDLTNVNLTTRRWRLSRCAHGNHRRDRAERRGNHRATRGHVRRLRDRTTTASNADTMTTPGFRSQTETKWGLTGIGIIVVLAVVISGHAEMREALSMAGTIIETKALTKR